MLSVDVSIIIVSWNVKDILKICLESIIKFTRDVNYEIIIVDNNSSDGTADEVLKFVDKHSDLDIKFIPNSINCGFSKANNIGLEQAKGKYILFLNPDTEFKDNCLKLLCRYLDKNAEYGATGCKILYPDGSIYHPCARGFPTPLNTFYHLVFLTRFFPKNRRFGSLDMEFWDKNDSRDVECLVGAFILVRHDVLRQVGSFQDIFFMYGEDIDLCYRIIKEGWKIRYIADCHIIHHTEKSSEQVKINNFKTVMKAESNWLFQIANHGSGHGFLYRIVTLTGSLFRFYTIGSLLLFSIISGFKEKTKFLNKAFGKNIKLLTWSLGMEKWAKQLNLNSPNKK